MHVSIYVSMCNRVCGLSDSNEIQNISRAFHYVYHLLADIKQERNQTFSGRVVILYIFTLEELMTLGAC